jgi:hypothetical protein
MRHQEFRFDDFQVCKCGLCEAIEQEDQDLSVIRKEDDS